ncbi:signal transduction histidine kinase [Salinisphaera hydrothermalis C41B8]|uniref:Signal transduction histidine kinase n=1 Tax=Salinisphaera hydrothermalis (strain C41B8) TaxID=1304275 RepID=A0A084IRH3_SALHC|nr:signal transduction histidine kinase [Salinisphaera hydrothermalis C41B8]
MIDVASTSETLFRPEDDASGAKNETLEDYTLRYAPHSFRRWGPMTVAITALGGIAYLADFSIGASIAISYGTANAILAILFAAALIFITGLPVAYYAARYNIDLDLITRGAGFGYYGSVLTAIIFASFTFIFFALEGSIMAQGLLVGLGIPLWLGYLIATMIVLPLVIYGMKALSKLQLWTTPFWLVLMAAPVIYLVSAKPQVVGDWLQYTGTQGYGGVSLAAVMLGAGVVLALMGQIGEQIDYLRFMPAKTADNRRQWWTAVLAAGPGWVVLGAIKQMIGALLAFYLLSKVAGSAATEPVRQFVSIFSDMVPMWLALALSVVLVVISQIKINVTNAYSGSLAWTNAFTRITRHYPGRVVFVVVNVSIALALMEGDMFAVLNNILGFYSNCAIAWVVVVATDIVINKYMLGISPKLPEFRRGMLYPINPVGTVSFILAAGLAIAAYFGVLGAFLSSYPPLIAVAVGVVCPPILAIATRGRFYLRKSEDGVNAPRFTEDGTPSSAIYACTACNADFERPDVLYSAHHNGVVCSLCRAVEPLGAS